MVDIVNALNEMHNGAILHLRYERERYPTQFPELGAMT